MAMELSLRQREIIGEVFEPGRFARLTASFGYDVKAGFLPEEMESFSQQVVNYVLDRFKSLPNSGSNDLAVREVAIPQIREEILKVCKVVPQSQVFYKHPMSGGLCKWLFSWILGRS